MLEKTSKLMVNFCWWKRIWSSPWFMHVNSIDPNNNQNEEENNNEKEKRCVIWELWKHFPQSIVLITIQ